MDDYGPLREWGPDYYDPKMLCAHEVDWQECRLLCVCGHLCLLHTWILERCASCDCPGFQDQAERERLADALR